ncbi:MAG: dTMP kinase [Thermoplasmata archaeon]|nr:dTMP kinase [Thermoplasmata archaeon]MCI4353765.1 dTMP kinase [Thermoplasmata archaeon]
MTRPRVRGRLLALEGIDGAGKSTLQRSLLRRLRAAGLRAAPWREPIDAGIGKAAQALAPSDPLGAAIEFTVDRWLARPRLERLLASSDLVISDRSFYSTLAYQGSALTPTDRRAVARLQEAATVPPDRVLWLDLPWAAALDRVGARGHARAPLERARTLRRVATSYRGFSRTERWWVLDARLPPSVLADRAERWILPWLGRRRAPRGRGRG